METGDGTAPEEASPGCHAILSLKGKYREIATEIDVEILNQDNGMTELFKVLDANFKNETVDSSFSAYLEFEHFGRAHLSVHDYILEFERRYNKIKRLNMTLPDEILGCKLLDCSGLDQKEKQMVLTSVKSLKFEDIKSSMKRIFSSSLMLERPELMTMSSSKLKRL